MGGEGSPLGERQRCPFIPEKAVRKGLKEDEWGLLRPNYRDTKKPHKIMKRQITADHPTGGE